MKAHTDLKDFINEYIFIESTFYIIDFAFWNSWKEDVKWNKEETYSGDIKKDPNDGDNIKINLSAIMDNYNGKLKQGLVYFKDFVIVNAK